MKNVKIHIVLKIVMVMAIVVIISNAYVKSDILESFVNKKNAI